MRKIRNVLRKIYAPILLRIQYDTQVKGYGNKYGGYCIATDRLKDRDAGSIVVYSFGIGEDLSFSEELLNDDGFGDRIEIYAFDPTPRSAKYVGQHRLSSDKRFHFSRIGIADHNGEGKLFLPKNPEFVSGALERHEDLSASEVAEVELRTIGDIAKDQGHDEIDILKLDVEGTEFSVMHDVLESGISIGQICVEIHDRMYPDGFFRLKHMLEDMYSHEYRIVHVSGSHEELTFIRVHRSTPQ